MSTAGARGTDAESDRPAPTERRPSSTSPASATLTELRDLFDRFQALNPYDLGADEVAEGRRVIDAIRALALWYARRLRRGVVTPESW